MKNTKATKNTNDRNTRETDMTKITSAFLTMNENAIVVDARNDADESTMYYVTSMKALRSIVDECADSVLCSSDLDFPHESTNDLELIKLACEIKGNDFSEYTHVRCSYCGGHYSLEDKSAGIVCDDCGTGIFNPTRYSAEEHSAIFSM